MLALKSQALNVPEDVVEHVKRATLGDQREKLSVNSLLSTYLAELERVLAIIHKKHARHKDNETLTVASRLRVACVDLVLHLLKRQAL